MAERNEGLSPNELIEFRIGINLGDIILDSGPSAAPAFDIEGCALNIGSGRALWKRVDAQSHVHFRFAPR